MCSLFSFCFCRNEDDDGKKNCSMSLFQWFPSERRIRTVFVSTFFTDVKETSKVCSQQEQQTTTTAGHWFREMNDNFCSIILGTISELSAVSQKKYIVLEE